METAGEVCGEMCVGLEVRRQGRQRLLGVLRRRVRERVGGHDGRDSASPREHEVEMLLSVKSEAAIRNSFRGNVEAFARELSGRMQKGLEMVFLTQERNSLGRRGPAKEKRQNRTRVKNFCYYNTMSEGAVL